MKTTFIAAILSLAISTAYADTGNIIETEMASGAPTVVDASPLEPRWTTALANRFSDTATAVTQKLSAAKASAGEAVREYAGPVTAAAAVLALMSLTRHEDHSAVALTTRTNSAAGSSSALVGGLGDLNGRLDSLDGLASSGSAIALAMPVVTPRADKPMGCGIGTGGFNGKHALAASCAKMWAGRSGTEATGRVGVGAAGGTVGVSASMTWLF